MIKDDFLKSLCLVLAGEHGKGGGRDGVQPAGGQGAGQDQGGGDAGQGGGATTEYCHPGAGDSQVNDDIQDLR